MVSQYVKDLSCRVLERSALATSLPFPNAKVQPPHCGLRMIAKIFLKYLLYNSLHHKDAFCALQCYSATVRNMLTTIFPPKPTPRKKKHLCFSRESGYQGLWRAQKKDRLSVFFQCPVPKASALPTTGLVLSPTEGRQRHNIRTVEGTKKRPLVGLLSVPGTGLEPAHLSIHAPETCASTNSAIRALFVSGFFVCAQDKT